MSDDPSSAVKLEPSQAPMRDALGRVVAGSPSLNPGGRATKEKREFLARLKSDDFDEIYRAFLELVVQRNVPAVLRAVEYVAGKPREEIDVSVSSTEAPDLDLSKLTLDQLKAFRELVAAAKAGP